MYGFSERLPVPLRKNVSGFIYDQISSPTTNFFLIIILIYVFIKKKLLRDEKEDLENLKLLQELLYSGTINDNEFQNKKNRITSKW